MKKTIGIVLALVLLGGILFLIMITHDLKKQKDNINKQLIEFKTNIEINKKNENNYNEKKMYLEIIKNEKKQIKEKYDEVNLWNQEIISHLN